MAWEEGSEAGREARGEEGDKGGKRAMGLGREQGERARHWIEDERTI